MNRTVKILIATIGVTFVARFAWQISFEEQLKKLT